MRHLLTFCSTLLPLAAQADDVTRACKVTQSCETGYECTTDPADLTLTLTDNATHVRIQSDAADYALQRTSMFEGSGGTMLTFGAPDTREINVRLMQDSTDVLMITPDTRLFAHCGGGLLP